MAGNDITGDPTVIHAHATDLGKVATAITDLVQAEPPMPNVGANGGVTGGVDFPDATAFSTAYQAAHHIVVGGVRQYGTTVSAMSKATSDIADDYANTSDVTKVDANKVHQALNDLTN
jgi:hypothetical protein